MNREVLPLLTFPIKTSGFAPGASSVGKRQFVYDLCMKRQLLQSLGPILPP